MSQPIFTIPKQITEVAQKANNIPQAANLNTLRNSFAIPDSVKIIIGDKLPGMPKGVQPSKQQDFSIDGTDNADQSLEYKSLLNTLIYTNIEFLPGTYETSTKGVFKSFGSSENGPERLRYEAVLINISQDKKIITTEIQGRNGTVKEYIGLDDYNIQINGVIVGGNGQRPMDQIIALKRMLDAPVAIEVANTLLQAMGIHYLVLKSYQMDEDEGGYAYQKFTLTFLSDIQQELELIDL